MAETFGEMFKRLRVASGQTLRSFCAEHGHDPGNISKLERGRLPPPESGGILNGYARNLGLTPGSEEWQAFKDAAAIGRGMLPPDLMDDQQVVDKLPVLFRVMRNTRADGSFLDELVDKIRRS